MQELLNTIVQGNCLEILPEIVKRYPKNQIAVITDPPYGGDYDTDYTRFTGGKHDNGRKLFDPIEGDNKPFDPIPWLTFNYVTLWGYQHFAQQIPLGSILVWNKRRDIKAGKFLSDGELGWEKGGKGIYCFNFVWDGFDRQAERGKTLHPTQKA